MAGRSLHHEHRLCRDRGNVGYTSHNPGWKKSKGNREAAKYLSDYEPREKAQLGRWEGWWIAAGLTAAGTVFTLVTLVTAFRWVFG
jgi:hypothetical protein